ncbi:MAG: methylmalonate-semialdehyde dehydrogenase (CoA acylating) [Planctomycetota bacterium]|nr:MAG: methylmalonate-semialdehyde dehydrogenase (CoA acylating) [Planctomycetota bacterium]
MVRKIQNLIGGEWISGSQAEVHQIINPNNGVTTEYELNYSTEEDVDKAVAVAKEAFPAWRNTSVVKRCRILFHVKELLEQSMDELAETLSRENGKTVGEAAGSIRRGIEVVEFAAGMPSLSKGDFIENIAGEVDGYIYREPLGVVVGGCPFNFPGMIPMWMIPVALACGNTFILKPSEKCPATATKLVEIFKAGGIPDGVLNLVQGDAVAFNRLITHKDVKAISFVGSTPVAKHVWETGTSHGKRVQALGGAKNYIIVMPDASPKETVNAIIGSSYGCAGERCMASSILLLVGEAEKLLNQVVEAAKNIKVGDVADSSTQMGPLVTPEHKERVLEYIKIGVNEGANLILDGREVTVEGKEKGNFVGPTIFDNVNVDMRIAKEEIFGPVLSVMRATNLGEAIEMANTSLFGNGGSIFTESGTAAREFRTKVECGMLGINTGVPAPMAFFSFGGHKNSFFGDLRAHGPDGVEFYTKKKAIIEQWNGGKASESIWGK